MGHQPLDRNGRWTLRFSAVVMACCVACGARSTTDWVHADDAVGTHAAGDGASDAGVIVTDFPGVYQCTSAVISSGSVGALASVYVGGGSGTLTIAQTAAVLTAVYVGDFSAKGTLKFTATSSSTADPVIAGQTIQISCPQAMTEPLAQMGTLDVASGSLTFNGNTLVLSLEGTLRACSPAATSVVLTCTSAVKGR